VPRNTIRVHAPHHLHRIGLWHPCATVFEDVVKTICTTNCSWWNTKLTVTNLCRMFGERSTVSTSQTRCWDEKARFWPVAGVLGIL
jgi:hypothetical protein